MTAGQAHGLDAVANACGQALAMNAVSKDVVLNLLSREAAEPPSIPVVLPDRLRLGQDPVADCTRYDALLREARHVA